MGTYNPLQTDHGCGGAQLVNVDEGEEEAVHGRTGEGAQQLDASHQDEPRGQVPGHGERREAAMVEEEEMVVVAAGSLGRGKRPRRGSEERREEGEWKTAKRNHLS